MSSMISIEIAREVIPSFVTIVKNIEKNIGD